MSELVTARISAHAARLGLHQLAASAPALIQRAHDAQLGYADFLDLILGEETAAKDDRRFASALHVSGLPHHKTLDDFDFTFQPDLDIRKIKELATLDFVTQAANVALLGPPGTGKTHLAVALAVAACAAGRSVYFTSLDDMIR
jgi:DNA replication protein DnaC